jgi:hypothetical protein
VNKVTQHQLGDLEASGIVARNRAVAGSVAVNTPMFATTANYASISALDARLIAINAAIYTQAQLDKMTANDKILAVRLNDDPTTV